MSDRDNKTLFYIRNIPPDYGGGFLRVYRLAERFSNTNDIFGILTLSKKTRGSSFTKTFHLPSVIVFQPLFLILWFIFYSKKFKAIYIVSPDRISFLLIILAKLFKKRTVLGVTLAGVDSPLISSTNNLKKLYFKLKNIQFSIANKIVVNSPALFEECLSSGLDENKVRLIPNPVDTLKFFPPKDGNEKKELRNEFGIPTDKPVILFVGSINKRKGTDLFPLIFELLFKSNLDPFTFVMCGDREYNDSEDILSQIKRVFQNSKNKFLFIEQVSNVNELMRATDIFLFPTTNEGLPNVVLEAMASGSIIFSNLLPGITDFLLPTDFLVKANSIDQYVDKLKDALQNPQQYRSLIESNLKRIQKEFKVTIIDEKFRTVIFSYND